MATRCCSIAARPSIFGKTLFTAAFKELGMDWTYEPLEVRTESRLRDAIEEVRRGVRGCGVSMPWKAEVMALLDVIDPTAQQIGAINTIVNDNGTLTGYNTDYLGALSVYENRVGKGSRVLICGAGGVARAQASALKRLGATVLFTTRNKEEEASFSKQFDTSPIPWQERTSFKADILVNCTPVGMEPDADSMVLPPDALRNFRVIADMVIKPPRTKLLAAAEQAGCATIPGTDFVLEQAMEQFRLYTGREPPREVMERAMESIL